jgi:nucleoside-diphosphate-sugar epimerase
VDKRYLLIGSSGTLGSKFAECLPIDSINIPGKTIREWFYRKDSSATKRAIRSQIQLSSDREWILINCIGVTNPRANNRDLLKANYEIPLAILESVKGQLSTFVNLGSTLEHYILEGSNVYLLSKRKFSKYLEEINKEIKIINFKLNTVYGGSNNPTHMLIGHLENAIRHEAILPLSSGRQIREYQHVNDLVPALLDGIKNETLSGDVQVNTGSSLRIKEFVSGVMESFNLENLLKFDSLNDPLDDNYADYTETSNWLDASRFRDPIQGVADYIRSRIES